VEKKKIQKINNKPVHLFIAKTDAFTDRELKLITRTI